MMSPHHNGYPALSKLGGYLIGTSRRVGLDSQCDQIGVVVIGNGLTSFIEVVQYHISRCEAGQKSEHQWLPGPRPTFIEEVGSNESDLHIALFRLCDKPGREMARSHTWYLAGAPPCPPRPVPELPVLVLESTGAVMRRVTSWLS